MNATANVVKNAADSTFGEIVKNVNLSTVAAPSRSKMSFVQRFQDLIIRIGKFIFTAQNWATKKRLWIGALIFLKLLLTFCKEYGYTLGKKNLKGEHVYLTGAGSGIGRGLALKFGAMGCKLSISDINLDAVKETRELIIKHGVPAENIHVFKLDVSNRENITQTAATCRSVHGPITLLINNAGIVSGKTTLELTDEMINRTIAVNTTSHLYTIREFLPEMIANKKGHIVSIASMAGLAGIPGLADYCASKHGAIAIDESVRLELKKNGHWPYVKTTCICPYYINTGMFDGVKQSFPLYILSPEEVVDRIIAGIQQEESQVVIPWRGNIVFLLKLLPQSLVDSLGSILGFSSSMEDFKGRGSIDARIPGISAKKE